MTRWIFLGFGIAISGLLLVSAVMPWWTCTIHIPDMETGADSTLHVKIYQYGLSHDMVQLRDYISADETPIYQKYLALAYLAATVSAIILGAWLKRVKGSLILTLTGLGYSAYVLIAIFMVVKNRVGVFQIALTGWSNSTYTSDAVDIIVSNYSKLEIGYYFALSVGILLIILGTVKFFLKKF